MRRVLERILFSLIGLVAVAWTGYHIYSYYKKTIEIESVYEYTVSQNIVSEGIAIRDEQIIDMTASGVGNYLYEDSARVTTGHTIAEFFQSYGGDKDVKRMREIENEIKMLTEAQDRNVNNFSSAETLNRDIRGQLGTLSGMSSTGDFKQAARLREELVSLLNRRQIATSKTEDFSERINMLEAEYERLERVTSGESVVTVFAPKTGYFVREVDGYEEYLSSKIIGQYSLEDYIKAIRSKQEPPRVNYVGKLMTSHIWYFVANAKKYNIEYVSEGQTATLEFPDLAFSVPVRVKEIIAEKESEDAVVLFECSQLSSDIVNLRAEEVVIHFESYTGLRIPISSIRFQDGERGVYVLDENIVRFKKIDPVYEEQGFILSRMNVIDTPGYASDTVRLFARIVKGTDLYDGKTIQ